MAKVRELLEERTQVMESNGQYTSLELVYVVRDVVVISTRIHMNGTFHPATAEHYALDAVRKTSPDSLYGMARKNLRIMMKINESAYKVGRAHV